MEVIAIDTWYLKSVTFTISKADAILTFADSTLTKKTTDAAFTNTLTKMTDGSVTFKSGNTKVATVNSTSGLVTIKGAGTATITASSTEGKNYKAGSASYSLTVEDSYMKLLEIEADVRWHLYWYKWSGIITLSLGRRP